MDRARKQTDKILSETERRIESLYADNAPLRTIMQEYKKYAEKVQKLTEGSYKAYVDATEEDIKKEAKRAYKAEIRRYTTQSEEYQRLLEKIVDALADANAEALALVNDMMSEVYAINYNAVESECRKAGIKIGKTEVLD